MRKRSCRSYEALRVAAQRVRRPVPGARAGATAHSRSIRTACASTPRRRGATRAPPLARALARSAARHSTRCRTCMYGGRLTLRELPLLARRRVAQCVSARAAAGRSVVASSPAPCGRVARCHGGLRHRGVRSQASPFALLPALGSMQHRSSSSDCPQCRFMRPHRVLRALASRGSADSACPAAPDPALRWLGA